jgi:hypothetical protein
MATDISDDAVLQAAATLVAAKITAAATKKQDGPAAEAIAEEMASAIRAVRAGMRIVKQSKKTKDSAESEAEASAT